MDVKSQVLGQNDSQGNYLYCRVFYNENNERTNASVHLQLRSEKKIRLLGNVDFMQHIFYCKRKTAKHLHRISNSFGFNWTILQDEFLNIQTIYLVVDDSMAYLFNKSIISEYGSFMNFQETGFELQRFLPFDIIKQKSKSFQYVTEQRDTA